MMQHGKIEDEIRKHGSGVFVNVGDSMMPLLRERADLIHIERCTGRLKKYDVPLYKRDNGQYVLHRILKVREQDYVICGDNRYRKEYGITDRHIIGVMTGVTRDGKWLSVQDGRYRLYVHLWCDFFVVRAGILRIRAFAKRLRRGLREKKR